MHNVELFAVDDIKQIAQQINFPIDNFLETIESLNHQGFLMKKGPNMYKLLLS